MRRLCWAFLLICTTCSIAAAADVYLFEAVKDPAYLRTLTALLKSGRSLPPWTRQVLKTKGDYVGSPAVYSTIEGTRYELFHTCKPHDCGNNKLVVMFAPKGAKAWGALVVDGKAPSYLGGPNAAQQSALQETLQ